MPRDKARDVVQQAIERILGAIGTREGAYPEIAAYAYQTAERLG